jgi:hypothetical protein
MSNEEVIELQELRKERDLQERKVQSLRYEAEDNELAMKALESWRKFRWVGFFISVTAFTGTFIFAYLHLWVMDETTPGLYQNYTDTIANSVSMVSIVFAIMILIALAVICVMQGAKVFMELGDSDAARLMAKARMKKNYHIEKERLLDQRKILQRSLYEEELKLKFMLPRLEELEGKEPSWR